MHERIKQVRVEAGLTLEEFGDRIGVSRPTAGKMEKGVIAVTERNIRAICREFSVSREWLETGQGEMHTGMPDDLMDRLVRQYNLGETGRKFIEAIARFPESKLLVVNEFIQALLSEQESDEDDGPTEEEVVEQARREYRLQKEARARSKASGSTA